MDRFLRDTGCRETLASTIPYSMLHSPLPACAALVLIMSWLPLSLCGQVEWGPCLYVAYQDLAMSHTGSSHLSRPGWDRLPEVGFSGGIWFRSNNTRDIRFSSGLQFAYERGAADAANEQATYGGGYGSVRMELRRVDMPLIMLVRMLPKWDLQLGMGFSFTGDMRYTLTRNVMRHEWVDGTLVQVIEPVTRVYSGKPPGHTLTLRGIVGVTYALNERTGIVLAYDQDLSGSSQWDSIVGRLHRLRVGLQWSVFGGAGEGSGAVE